MLKVRIVNENDKLKANISQQPTNFSSSDCNEAHLYVQLGPIHPASTGLNKSILTANTGNITREQASYITFKAIVNPSQAQQGPTNRNERKARFIINTRGKNEFRLVADVNNEF